MDDRVLLPRRVLAGATAIFLLMGALAAAYGPLLEHLGRRFDISLSVAGGVLSAHFAGALLGVILSMPAIGRVSGRISLSTSLGCLGLGCVGVALAPSWPTFLAAVFVIGLGYGALDIGLMQLVAHSASPRRSAVLNALTSAFGVGAVAGPILISTLSEAHLAQLYAAGAVLAVGLVPAVAGISGRPPVVLAKAATGPRVLIGIFVIAYVLYVGLETSVGGWMTSYLESVGLGSLVAATLTSGFWMAVALGRLLIALVPARVPEPVIVLTGCAIAAIALLAGLVGHAAPYAYIVTGLAIAPIFPSGVVWLAKLTPGDARATSWLFPASMLGGIVVPGGIGVVISQFGIGWTPAVLSAVATGSLVAFALAAGRTAHRPANRT